MPAAFCQGSFRGVSVFRLGKEKLIADWLRLTSASPSSGASRAGSGRHQALRGRGGELGAEK
jgi:hypothetical protein